MIDRKAQYEREARLLAPSAARSLESRGREHPEEPCRIRTAFQRDRDRIIHSKAFRRLKHKTQVFIAPEGDHYRTRLTHTLEVSQISRTVARALRLNEDLTEAIALGHDLGHTPFGHTGERVLDQVYPGGFEHNRQSLRVVEELETKGDRYRGLNLCHEVRDGILGHSGDHVPETLEGQIVRIADRVAYINHDIDDARRAEILRRGDLPPECREVLGESHGERINTMVEDTIAFSEGRGEIAMSGPVDRATERLRDYLFDRVYIDSMAKGEERKAENLIRMLYEYYRENWREVLSESSLPEGGREPERLACDYTAGMTDRYALMKYRELFVPRPWGARPQEDRS